MSERESYGARDGDARRPDQKQRSCALVVLGRREPASPAAPPQQSTMLRGPPSHHSDVARNMN